MKAEIFWKVLCFDVGIMKLWVNNVNLSSIMYDYNVDSNTQENKWKMALQLSISKLFEGEVSLPSL